MNERYHHGKFGGYRSCEEGDVVAGVEREGQDVTEDNLKPKASRDWLYDAMEVDNFLQAYDAEFLNSKPGEEMGRCTDVGWRVVFALCRRVRWVQGQPHGLERCDSDILTFEVHRFNEVTGEMLEQALAAAGQGIILCDCGEWEGEYGSLHIADYSGVSL